MCLCLCFCALQAGELVCFDSGVKGMALNLQVGSGAGKGATHGRMHAAHLALDEVLHVDANS